MSDKWWLYPSNLAALGRYLAEQGWSLKEYAKAIEKPWNLATEWHEYIGAGNVIPNDSYLSERD